MKMISSSPGTTASSTAATRQTRKVADFWGAIHGFLLRRGLGHHDAQDITQSFFLKLARCGLGERWEREAESEIHLQNLLLRGVTNHCTDEHRRTQRVRRGGSLRHFSLEGDEAAHEVACGRPTPCEAAELCELKREMSLAIREIGNRHAARGRGTQFAVAMNCLLDEGTHGSQREAARALDLRENAFRALLFRIRRELAGELRPDCAA